MKNNENPNPAGLQRIDQSAIKANQVIIILFNLLAFILDIPWLVLLTALVMLLGVLRNKPGFNALYVTLLKPIGWIKPHVIDDHPQPHRFAQLLGGLFLLAASVCLFFGLPLLGWLLAWLVIALAGLNAFAGFCLGCAIYYWLARLGVPGFVDSPSPPGFQEEAP